MWFYIVAKADEQVFSVDSKGCGDYLMARMESIFGLLHMAVSKVLFSGRFFYSAVFV
jgi:hypothetical protein